MRTCRSVPLVLAILFRLAWTTPAVGFPNPVSSSLELRVMANANLGPVVAFHSTSQSSTLYPLEASVTARAQSEAVKAIVRGSAEAEWQTPALGSVVFKKLGWTIRIEPIDPNDTAEAELSNGVGFRYTFVADATGYLRLRYRVSVTATDFGVPVPGTVAPSGFSIDWATGANQPVQIATAQANTSAAFTVPIVAGERYTLRITPGVLTSLGGFHFYEASMSGTFGFAIDTAQ